MDLVVGASNDAVKSLVSKLGSLLAQEYTLIAGVRDDIQYINDELASMQAFLNRIKRADDHNEQRQDWMKQVREVSYDIEDCVDNVGHRLDGEPRGTGAWMYICRKWYVLKTLYARHCIATEIGNLKIRAQHVSERRTRYGVENLADVRVSAESNSPGDRLAPLPQLIGTRAPVGIEDAMDKLEPWFTNAKQLPVVHNLRFLAIVGFGGLGKTTLAMALYRKFGLEEEFGCRASVLASQKFHLSSVLRSLVEQFHEQRADASKNDLQGIEDWRDEQLVGKLRTQLSGKRYIILVDDIWSVSAWEKIRDSLPNGGSIVVTTRFNSVAEACRRRQGKVHKLEPLTIESSCRLFNEIIINADYYDRCPLLTADGRNLMLKCTGRLPLAIVLVAGLVATKVKSEQNLTVNNHLKKLEEALSAVLLDNLTSEGVTQILDHCYKDLQADLKTCLLYLSMFPKGCRISRKRLIRRWIAEGFVSEKRGKTVEEVAEDCFNELIGRNLIRAVNNSSNGKVKNCQIHDMVLEYIVFKSSDENFITVIGGHWQTPFPTYKVRRLSVHKSGRHEKDTVEKMKLSHVRSLTVVGSFRALHSTLHKFQILQVLDLEGCKDLSFNQIKKICNMHPLKYLSLRRTDVEKIPSKISRLEFLEVLDIRETKVSKLPKSAEMLQRMTHLLAGDKSKRIALKLTLGITKMTGLHTLSGVEICGSSANVPMAGNSDGTSGAPAAQSDEEEDEEKGKQVKPPSNEGETEEQPSAATNGVKHGTRFVAMAGTSDGPSGASAAQSEEREEQEDKDKQENSPSNEGATAAQPPSVTNGVGDETRCCCNRQFELRFRSKAASTRKSKDLRPVAALENLTSLKKFTIYKVTKFTNSDNLLLLSAIEHLSSCSLKFLEIDDDFSGFLDRSLKTSQAPPEHLHTLRLSGMLLRVPKWIGSLHNLEKLTLSLTSLTTKTLDILAKLPELFSLIFSLDAAKAIPSVHKILQNNTLKTGGAIFVQPGGFEKLKLLRFVAPVLPPLSFLEGAMPELQRIELRFRMIEGVYGLENLKKLQQVVLTVSSQAPDDAKAKASQIKVLARLAPSAPSLVLREYNESSEEK